MVIPAAAISTLIGALNGYVLTKWTFKGANVIFALILFGCFILFQIVLIPMARTLGLLGIASSTAGLILVHVVYGICFTTLYFRNFYAAFPTDLVKAAKIDGAGFFTIFWADHAAELAADPGGDRDPAVHQHSGTTSCSAPRSRPVGRHRSRWRSTTSSTRRPA